MKRSKYTTRWRERNLEKISKYSKTFHHAVRKYFMLLYSSINYFLIQVTKGKKKKKTTTTEKNTWKCEENGDEHFLLSFLLISFPPSSIPNFFNLPKFSTTAFPKTINHLVLQFFSPSFYFRRSKKKFTRREEVERALSKFFDKKEITTQ